MPTLKISEDESAGVYSETHVPRSPVSLYLDYGSEAWFVYLTRVQARKLAAMLIKVADAKEKP